MKLTQLTDLFWRFGGSQVTLQPGASLPSIQPNVELAEKTIDADYPSVEFVAVDQIGRHVEAWADLAGRSLEPNVFLDPSFALPAVRHFAEVEDIGFLLAWRQTASSWRGRLIALWPIVPSGVLFGLSIKTWVHEFCCSGAPLLDRTQAFAAVDAIVGFLNESVSRACALTTSQLKKDGPTFALLSHYASAKKLELKVVRQYDRAALDRALSGQNSRDLVSSKKKKELRRQFRRLCERGPVGFGISQDVTSLRQHIESFLALEAKGWKGREGGAFLNQPELTAFLRTMTRKMGGDGKCRVYWMTCGGKIIAANIVLFEGSAAYFWKTAYDEDFAFASPGVLLTMNMTDAMLNEPKVLSADSCAVPGHPMIDQIWPGRIRAADVMLSLGSDKIRAFNGAVQREQFRQRLREKAKSALSHMKLV